MPDLTGQRFGQYEILGLIAEGGMAAVYRARQTSLNREVAIKVIKTGLIQMGEFVERFKREAMTIAALNHLHILRVIDYGQQDDMVYLVMDLLTGGSLSDLIRQGPLSLERASQVLNQIAGALDYAHKRGVIHRDMKPQNVLMDQAGNAFITDFGIAKLRDQNTQLTQSGGAMGTPAYMAPEQWRGDPVDARADVYSLGVIVFEMLTGKTPFGSDTTFGLMHKHVYEPPPPVRDLRPDLPLSVERVVNKALAKDREKRFNAASELATAFAEAITGSWTGDEGTVELLIMEPATPAAGTGATGSTGVLPARQTGTTTATAAAGSATGSVPAVTEPARRGGLPVALLAVLALLIVGGVGALLLSRDTSGASATATGAPVGVIASATSTTSPTATITPTVTLTPSLTPGVETRVALTALARQTATAEAIALLSATPNEEQRAAMIINMTDTAIAVASFTATPTPSDTPTATVTPSLTPSATVTPSLTATASPTTTPTLEATVTPTSEATLTPTAAVTAIGGSLGGFAAGAGGIVFTSNRDGQQEIYITEPGENAPIRNLSNYDRADDYSPIWSPDGKRIAFVSRRFGNQEILVMNADGSNVVRVTETRGVDNYDPAWSPDGRRMAFTSNRDGSADIWVMNADGTEPRRITGGPANDRGPVWSPDGRTILFNSTREVGDQIYSINADGSGEPRRLTPRTVFANRDPVWSPDGRTILYWSDEGGNPDIFVMNADGSNITRLTRVPDFDGFPTWSPDGQNILFLSNGRLPGSARVFNLFIMNRDGSDPRRLSRQESAAVQGRISWR